MKGIYSSCIRPVFETTGFIADVLAILNYWNLWTGKSQIGSKYQLPAFLSSFQLSYNWSLFFIFWGLTFVGVFIWARLYRQASTPFEGVRRSFSLHLLLAASFLFFHFLTYNFLIYSGETIIIKVLAFIAFVVLSEIFSWEIYKFFS
jgi:hypothetical protein